MRLLHLVTSTRRRGAEVFAVRLADALDSRGAPGETVALVGGGDVPVHWVGRGRFHAITLREVRRRARRADLLVGHGSDALLGALLGTWGTGTPFVYRSIGDPDYWVRGGVRSRRVGMALRRAARVVALWSGARDRLIQRHRLHPDHVVTIPNGVPVEQFPVATPQARRAARAALGLPEHRRMACVVGALTPEKNPAAAVRAVASTDAAALVIAGDGPLRGELEALAQRLMPGAAHFLGPVDDVVRVLTASDVLMLPSLSEGAPAVLIEAGLVGIPAVATRVGGVAEIIDDDRTGVLVAPSDDASLASGLQRALGASTAMGARARDRCRRRFGLDVVADAWKELLCSVTRPSRLGSR